MPSARHVSTTAPSASPPSLSQLMASRRSVVPENGNPAVSGRSIGVDSNLSGNVRAATLSPSPRAHAPFVSAATIADEPRIN